MTREDLRNLIKEELLNREIENETAEEIADSVAERCCEEGLFIEDKKDDWDYLND